MFFKNMCLRMRGSVVMYTWVQCLRRPEKGSGRLKAGVNSWMWVTVWVLASEPRSSARTVSILNHWATSQPCVSSSIRKNLGFSVWIPRRPLHDLKGPPYSLTNQCQKKTFSTEKSALLGLYPQSPPFNVVLSPARLFLNRSEAVYFLKIIFQI